MPRPDAADRSEFTGNVIVAVDASAARLLRARLGELKTFLYNEGVPDPVVRRLITSVTPERIEALEREARQGPLPPLRSLNTYYTADISEYPGVADWLVSQLADLDWVITAYRERRPQDPCAAHGPNPFSDLQVYLDAAATGIDARWMWRHANGSGADVVVVDVEEAWNFHHEDLAPKLPQVISGVNRGAGGQPAHGTAVLGILSAVDNDLGVVGIAPFATLKVASRYHRNGSDTNVADAIAAAASAIDCGDVILVEVERAPGLPTEVEPADFDAIRLACGIGRVVVAAAGNGHVDMDCWVTAAGKQVLNPASADFADSGAIMVGAMDLGQHRVISSYGSRVDCYAHGSQVATAGYGDLTIGAGPNAQYTGKFNGTSAASAIIAGAAVLVQGRFRALNGGNLPPLAMRKVLSNPATGTPQDRCSGGPVGVMPNLRAITRANPVLWDGREPPGP